MKKRRSNPILHELRRVVHWLEEIAKSLRGAPGHDLGRTFIQVTEVRLKPETPEIPMTPVKDHMQPLQLPSTSVRARLAVVNPRKADGSRVDSVVWGTNNETDLPLEAIPDDTVKDADGNEVLDPDDQLPLKIFSTFANTPNTVSGEGTVTVSGDGMADCDIVIKYSDPPVGHFAITAGEVPEA